MAHAPGLLSGEINWLPDESCFSLAARYHVVTVHRRARDSCLELFAHATAGARHDFTGQLGVLSARARGALGDGREIAYERTLLRYYLPFQTPALGVEAIDTLQGHDLSKLKSQLGLLSSKFRAHHPLKACRSCMSEDKERFGVAYWHLRHQYPGSWWCTQHEEPLLQFALKTNGIERFLLHLPQEDGLIAQPGLAASGARQPGMDLARLADELASSPVGRTFPRDGLAVAYGAELERRYGVPQIHASSTREVATDFQRVMSELRHLPEFSTLHAERLAPSAVLRRLLQPRSNSHPIWHLVMTHWLFGSWASLRAADLTEAPVREPAEPTCRQEQREYERLTEIFSMHRAGMSVRAIASSLHVDHKTASAWLARCGIPTPRRAKVLKDDIRQRAMSALKSGADKAQVAQAAGVSVITVTHLLRSEPWLHDHWKAARHAARQRQARDAWLDAVRQAEHGGIKLARSLAAAEYAWLYRNDRAWLLDQPKSPRQIPRRRYGAQWAQRDEQICFEVLARFQTLPVGLPPRVTLRAVMQASPSLERYRTSLRQLPLTRDILAALAQSRSRRDPG